MAAKRWIPFEEAVSEYRDAELSGVPDFLEAHKVAWRQVVSELRDGNLASRTDAPDSFVLVFASDHEVKPYSLGLGGEIPPLFWDFTLEAWDLQAKNPLLVSRPRFAFGPDFEFEIAGLIDNGELRGFAEAVFIQKGGILPRSRGDRGPGDKPELDRPIVDRAESAIKAGEPRAKVVARLSQEMIAANPKAAKKRLIRRLKERGVWEFK